MDITQWLDKYGVAYRPSRNWLQVNCPNCDDSKYHGAINPDSLVYTCFRCGKLSFFKTMRELCSHEENAVADLRTINRSWIAEPVGRVYPSKITMPLNCGDLTDRHKKYLVHRGFDPEYIINEWRVLGTPAISDVPMRIIIPVYRSGNIVTWTGRSILKNVERRYENCPESLELESIKEVVYGIEKAKDTVIIVEGAFDAWRIGPGAVCVFGAVITKKQINALGKVPKRYILLDPDAKDKAKELAGQLRLFPGETYMIDIGDDAKDPDTLPESLLEELRRLLRD